ncbi:protein shisa-5-like [Crassostrea angulata]|uniref:protein shisa-5-like n=1 Tax=Magallana angulata TaxID=2784310 RepID=UPI0022B0F361|nr:protein shisa-5-like [Crassostrea angulata]
MAVSPIILSCVLATILPGAVWSSCYHYSSSYYCYYYYSYYYEIPVGTIIGAVVGGIAGLIFLCVIIVVVCIVCCKKKSTGTVIQPAGVSTMSSTMAYNTHPQHPQGWGVQPSAPPNPGKSYSHQQPYPPPPPASQTMPPPTYAENVVSGQPPRFAS